MSGLTALCVPSAFRSGSAARQLADSITHAQNYERKCTHGVTAGGAGKAGLDGHAVRSQLPMHNADTRSSCTPPLHRSDVSSNAFSGALPAELGNLQRMVALCVVAAAAAWPLYLTPWNALTGIWAKTSSPAACQLSLAASHVCKNCASGGTQQVPAMHRSHLLHRRTGAQSVLRHSKPEPLPGLAW